MVSCRCWYAGEIIYEPVLVAFWPEEDVLLEAHPDIYRRSNALEDEARVRQAAVSQGVDDLVDWRVIKQILQMRDGRPHSVKFDSLAPVP